MLLLACVLLTEADRAAWEEDHALEGDADADADADADGDADHLDEWVDVSEPWYGDAGCLDAGEPTPDGACVQTMRFEAVVSDPLIEEVLAEATVEAWLGDDPTSAADQELTADADGAVTLELPACQPLTVATSTPPEWEETVPTYEQHRVLPWASEGVVDGTIQSVSQATMMLIPAIIGIAQDDELALLVGWASDCNGDNLGGVQVTRAGRPGGVPGEPHGRWHQRGGVAPGVPGRLRVAAWAQAPIAPAAFALRAAHRLR